MVLKAITRGEFTPPDSATAIFGRCSIALLPIPTTPVPSPPSRPPTPPAARPSSHQQNPQKQSLSTDSQRPPEQLFDLITLFGSVLVLMLLLLLLCDPFFGNRGFSFHGVPPSRPGPLLACRNPPGHNLAPLLFEHLTEPVGVECVRFAQRS
jgi:hypothetical protein